MNFLGSLQKGPKAIKVQPPQIRKVAVKQPASTAASKPSPSTRPSTSNTPLNRISTQRSSSANAKTLKKRARQDAQEKRYLEPDRSPRRSASVKRKRPSYEQPQFGDSSEGSSDTDALERGKRPRPSASAEPDLNRKIRSLKSFSEEDDGIFPLVHAADVASLQGTGHYQHAHGGTKLTPTLYLQYPSASQQERYEFVAPQKRDDGDLRPLDEIFDVISLVSEYYLRPDQNELFTNEKTGFIRRLKRATNLKLETDFREAVEDYNKEMIRLRLEGTISKNLDNLNSLDFPLVQTILAQVYSRTVSMNVNKLKRYQNGTDNVYGELLPPLVSKILQQTKLKSNQIFVDLGSGVGNVVLQAALEVGCESWGCEIMPEPCELALLQYEEFKARCRMWGLAPGEVHLDKGDFLQSPSIGGILKKADVVLVNNQAFTPELNDKLKLVFLDLKEGCKVVSLKPFASEGNITERTAGSITNFFKVERKEFFSLHVSWKDEAGDYFIQTKDSSRLEKLGRRTN